MNTEQEIVDFGKYLLAHGCTNRESCVTLHTKFRAGWRPGRNPREAIIAIVQALAGNGNWLHACADPTIVANHYLSGAHQQQKLEAFVASLAQVEETRGRMDSQVATKAGAPRSASARHEVLPIQIGPYLIEKQLGRGGMGVVYKGKHKDLGVLAAIKVISPGIVYGPEEVVRFKSEARVILSLAHPNLIRGYGAEFDSQPPYMAMAFVEGCSLGIYAYDLRKAGDVLGIIDLMAAVCDGVAAMHAQNLVHRDLKPDNVMVDAFGRPVVLDPGMVKPIGSLGADGKPLVVEDQRMTHEGQVLGTIAFMPPEQALGETNKIGKPADVYSLGKILYFLLTGEHVHDVRKQKLSLIQDIISPLPATAEQTVLRLVPATFQPAALWEILALCLATEPADRYSDAVQMAEALRAYASSIRNRDKIAAEWREKWGLRLLVGAAVASAMFGFVAVAMGLKRNAEREAREAAEARAQAEASVAAVQSLRGYQADEFLACQALVSACDWTAAETRLLALLERDAAYEPARYALAHVYFNQSKAADCVREWRYLLEHGSEARRSEYAFYVTFHGEQLDEQTDTSVYEPVIRQITDSRYLGLARAMLALSDGAIASKRGDGEAAMAYYRQCEQHIPAVADTDELYWLVAGMRGYLAWKISPTLPARERVIKNNEARSHLEQSVARNPDFPMSIFWLADAYRNLRQFDAASVLYLRLQLLMPNWVVPRTFRVNCMLERDLATNNDDVILVTTQEVVRVIGQTLTDLRPNPRQACVAKLCLANAWLARCRIYHRRQEKGNFDAARQTFTAITDELLAAPDDQVRAEERASLQQLRGYLQALPELR